MFQDWPYVAYQQLKKLIKELTGGKRSIPSTPSSHAPNSGPGKHDSLSVPLTIDLGGEARAAFWAALDIERTKVQDFYESELRRHHEQLQLLLEQITADGAPTERAETSLQRASTDLYRTLQLLRNYCILNYTGLLKLAKKFDKAVAKHQRLQEAYKDHADTTSFATHERLEVLCTDLERAFADKFCDGSLQVAPARPCSHRGVLARPTAPASARRRRRAQLLL